jgi:hypothetical protein
LPQGKSFLIVQARITDLEQAYELVRKAGSRLVGLGHPGGAPRLLGPAKESSSWCRIEFWPDAVFFLHGDGQGPPHVQVLNTDAQMGRWRADWDACHQNLSGEVVKEALAGPGMNVPPVGGAVSFSLDDHDTLSSWLAAWAECLTEKAPRLPLVRPDRQPLSARARKALAFGLTALVLFGCWSFHFFLDWRLQHTHAEIRRAQEPENQRKFLETQIQGMQAKQNEFQARTENIEKALRVLGKQRQRQAILLVTLATHYPENLVVEKIDTEGGEPQLRGNCLEPELADQFANKLSQCLVTHGWEVQAPKKQARNIMANGSPWSFEISFKSASDMILGVRLDSKNGKMK